MASIELKHIETLEGRLSVKSIESKPWINDGCFSQCLSFHWLSWKGKLSIPQVVVACSQNGTRPPPPYRNFIHTCQMKYFHSDKFDSQKDHAVRANNSMQGDKPNIPCVTPQTHTKKSFHQNDSNKNNSTFASSFRNQDSYI